MLQRTVRRTGRRVVLRIERQMPVLVVEQARDDLLARRPPAGLGEDEQRTEADDDQDRDQRGQQSPAEPGQSFDRVDRGPESGLIVLCADDDVPQQRADEEVPRQGEEHVDTAGHPPEPDVEARHQDDGQAPQTVEVGAVTGDRVGGYRRWPLLNAGCGCQLLSSLTCPVALKSVSSQHRGGRFRHVIYLLHLRIPGLERRGALIRVGRCPHCPNLRSIGLPWRKNRSPGSTRR